MLTVSLSDDKLSAFIHGDSGEPLSPSDALALIRTLLEDRGVVYGISENSVAQAAKRLAEQGTLPPTLLAMGDLPSPGKLPGLFFDIPVYEQSRFPEILTRDLTEPITYYQLLEHVRDPYVAEEGETVGRLIQGEEAQSGKDVTGQEYFPPADDGPDKGVSGLGAGLSLQGDEKHVVATCRGLVVKRGAVCVVWPVNPNAAFTLDISEDRLSATVTLHAAGRGGRLPTLEKVTKALDQTGLLYEKPPVGLEKAIDRFRMSPSESIFDIPVARGVAPTKGENGWVEYLIDLSFSHKPSIRQDGRADYYSVHTYEPVKKGQPLVRIHLPTRGEPGKDVHGNPLEGEKGKPVQFRAGQRVVRAPDDPYVLVAATHGHAYLRNGKLMVEEVLRIRSDVDFRSGNIQFPGDVVVDGDVKSGFGVRAAGNVYVKGTVEDATIESKGNVVVYGGFVGQGKGMVRSDGDVVVAFVRNQTIRARTTIMISGEVVEARLFAGHSILVESKKSCVMGGEISARTLVRVHTLGNESSVATRVRTGVDFIVETRIAKVDIEMKRLKNEREALANTIHQLTDEEYQGGLSSSKSMKRAQISIMAESIDRRLNILHEQKNGLREHMFIRGSQVQVLGEVFPNVIITISSQSHLVREHHTRCTFFLARGTVQCE